MENVSYQKIAKYVKDHPVGGHILIRHVYGSFVVNNSKFFLCQIERLDTQFKGFYVKVLTENPFEMFVGLSANYVVIN